MEVLLEHAEEPLVESAVVGLFRLSQLASQHVIVLLSGEGSDEVLSGYALHRITLSLTRLHTLARLIPSAAGGAWAGENKKPRKYRDWLRPPFRSRSQSNSNDISDSICRRMCAAGFQGQVGTACRDYFVEVLDRYQRNNLLGQIRYVDLMTWLPHDLLLKAYKMTMAAAAEVRVPFLDQDLVEF